MNPGATHIFSISVLAIIAGVSGILAHATPLWAENLEWKEMNDKTEEWMRAGKLDDAKEIALKALNFAEHRSETDLSCVASSLSNLGWICCAKNQLEEADKHFQRAMSIRKKTLPPEHRDIGALLLKQAQLSYLQGQNENANSLYLEALKIIKANAGSDSGDLVVTLSNYGFFLMNTGKLDGALPIIQQARTMLENSGKSASLDYAVVLSRIGEVHVKLNDFHSAEKTLQSALKIILAGDTAEHPILTRILPNLALVCEKQNEFNDAEIYYKQSLGLCEKVFGESHPETLMAFDKIASFFLKQKKFSDARRYLQRLLNLKEKSSTMKQQSLLATKILLATAYDLEGNPEEARTQFKSALTIADNCDDPGNNIHLHILERLIDVSQRLGEVEQAIQYRQLQKK